MLLTVYTGVYLNNNVVIILGAQWRDSTIHFHVSILSQTTLCGLFEDVSSNWCEVVSHWSFHFQLSRNKLCGMFFQVVQKTKTECVLNWPLEIGFLKVCCFLNCFLIANGRTLLEVMCPLQPRRLCEYEVTISSSFQIVVTENAHEEAALRHAPGSFLGQQEP